jgi:hypothetical protein
MDGWGGAILVVGFVPVAQAARLDVGVCIERHDQLSPEGRRDLVLVGVRD